MKVGDALRQLGEAAEDLRVDSYARLDPRVAHLDGDRRSVVEPRAVHLSDRRRGERRLLEASEALRGGAAEVFFDRVARRVNGIGGSRRVESAELLGELDTDLVGSCREHLA